MWLVVWFVARGSWGALRGLVKSNQDARCTRTRTRPRTRAAARDDGTSRSLTLYALAAPGSFRIPGRVARVVCVLSVPYMYAIRRAVCCLVSGSAGTRARAALPQSRCTLYTKSLKLPSLAHKVRGAHVFLTAAPRPSTGHRTAHLQHVRLFHKPVSH